MNNSVCYIDTHCHLNYLEQSCALTDVLKRAHDNHVSKMITVSIDWPDSDLLRGYCQSFENVFYSAGIHPHNAKNWHNRIQDLDFSKLVQDKKLVALGETGLDYSHGEEDRQEQIDLLVLHIEACKQYDLPIIIHCRAAATDMLSVLRQHYQPGTARGVIHCFQESLAVGQAFIDLGFYLSISGMVTFQTSKWRDFHRVVTDLPNDRLLVETDAPYLTPEPHRQRMNEPSYIPLIMERIATLKDCPQEVLAKQIYENTHCVFPRML